jgi:hypothetical protein
MEDCWLTVRETAIDIGISDGSAHTILTDDLGMCGVAAKFVPKLLSCEQKELYLDIAQDMLYYFYTTLNPFRLNYMQELY